MEKIDFKIVVDYIFQNKPKYHTINDYDKGVNFFMVNRKFAIKEIELSEDLNSKFIDNASALDYWFMNYRKVNKIPGWYWTRNPLEKKTDTKKKNMNQQDSDILMKYYDLSDNDLNFLLKYYTDDIKKELKKIK